MIRKRAAECEAPIEYVTAPYDETPIALAGSHQKQNAALAMTPVEELLKLPMLQADQVKDSLHAYQISKRGNSLRVMAEAVRWGMDRLVTSISIAKSGGGSLGKLIRFLLPTRDWLRM